MDARADGMQLQHEGTQRHVPRTGATVGRPGGETAGAGCDDAPYTEVECGYSEPAVRHVLVWEVRVEEMTGRSFGLLPSEL